MCVALMFSGQIDGAFRWLSRTTGHKRLYAFCHVTDKTLNLGVFKKSLTFYRNPRHSTESLSGVAEKVFNFNDVVNVKFQ